ncbi:adenine phosphoribosyltransferase [Patescibacteria group bacterium]|nr:MAG: adenine phosphoribosyltransferase [Patescibacteria group bacterium]
MDLKTFIKDVPDYPKAGIVFKDITPLLADKAAFNFAINQFAEKFSGQNVDAVVGIDARGFLLAAPVAYKLGAGLAIARKSGKLPRQCLRQDYILEYASNSLEMHADAILPGQKILIIDDVLATGGTMEATGKLVQKMGGDIVGIGFLMELKFLQGREKLKNYNIYSLLSYSK